MLRSFLTATSIALLLAAGAAHAQDQEQDQGQGVEWQVSMDFSMTEPMHMTMPTRTTTFCGSANPQSEPPPMKSGQCKIRDLDKSGSRVEYSVTCDMRHSVMTGEGWAEKTDANHYRGHMDISGETYGKNMQISMDYHGTRAGSCNQP